MTLKVSLMLDGQIAPTDVKAALDECVATPGLRDRYTVYRLVGDALKGNSTPDDGYSNRIIERMRRDGVKIEGGYDPLAQEQ